MSYKKVMGSTPMQYCLKWRMMLAQRYLRDTSWSIPELAERGLARIDHFYELLDGFLEGKDWLAADRLTLADITAFVAADFAKVVGKRPPENLKNLTRGYNAIKDRPSAKA